MRLHDLQVGQRFTTDKHRGKVFKIKAATSNWVAFEDIATGQLRHTYANRKTFRMEVELVTTNRVVALNEYEVEVLTNLLHNHYQYLCEMGFSEESKSEINALLLKLTGLPGRRTVLTEGE